MKAIISRKYLDIETLGKWIILDGYRVIYECFTLELPNLNNQHDISCILEGPYHVIKTYKTEPDGSKQHCFLIQNVPGRTFVYIHAGNFATGIKIDILGCILVGDSFLDLDGNGTFDIANSRTTLVKLLDILPDSFELIII